MWLAVEPGGGSTLTSLIQYGVLGVIVALLIPFAYAAYKIQTDRAEAAYKRETERADRLEAENQRLNTVLREQAIPALTNVVTVMQGSQELLRDLQREREYGYPRRHRDEEKP